MMDQRCDANIWSIIDGINISDDEAEVWVLKEIHVREGNCGGRFELFTKNDGTSPGMNFSWESA